MRIVVFSGTTEGRDFSRVAAALGIAVTVSVATDLGAEEQGQAPGITVHSGRLLPGAMAELLQGAALCVDATHPYAVEATRLYPRVLPTVAGITACEGAGIPHRNIIAMQGPFTLELNLALMQQFHIRYLVTKDGGSAGGFAEKAQAAAQSGAALVVLRRPEECGETAEEILQRCRELL